MERAKVLPSSWSYPWLGGGSARVRYGVEDDAGSRRASERSGLARRSLGDGTGALLNVQPQCAGLQDGDADCGAVCGMAVQTDSESNRRVNVR